MKTRKLKLNINQIRIIQILFLSIIVSVFGYVYMVNSIAFDIAQKGKITNQIALMNSEIGDLEFVILESKKEMTKDLAGELNLTQEIENDTIFVLRGKNTRLTFNE
jgi:hypothetical protein